MRIMFLAAMLAMTVGKLSATDLKLVSDLEGQNVRYRSVVGELTEAAFERLASSLLEPASVTLGAVDSYGSLQDSVIAGPRGFDHCSYGHWRSVLGGVQAKCPSMKQAAKIGSDVVVRSVDRNCQRSVKLLQGNSDPLLLTLDGAQIEILEMSFGPLTSEAKERRIVVHVYARTNRAASAKLAKALTGRIRDLTNAKNVGVELRSDLWFITDCGFPVLYPFEERPKVPTADEFSRTRYASCGVFESTHGEIRCFEGTSRP